MRLIDADELIEHVWRDKLDSRKLIAKMVDNAPTVKEIPTKIPISIFEQLISKDKAGEKSAEQEPCEDAISRQEALKYFEGWKNQIKYYHPYAKNFDIPYEEAIQRIKDVPPVKCVSSEKSNKWIPVSEGLPKKFSYVNCTCRSLIDDRADWVVETCYVPQPPNSPYSDWGNIPMLNCGECEVIAWMYRDIPKPYKAESEEKE